MKDIDELIREARRKLTDFKEKADPTWPQDRIDMLYAPYARVVIELQGLRSQATPGQRQIIDNLPSWRES
jgi:hypothetical protein